MGSNRAAVGPARASDMPEQKILRDSALGVEHILSEVGNELPHARLTLWCQLIASISERFTSFENFDSEIATCVERAASMAEIASCAVHERSDGSKREAMGVESHARPGISARRVHRGSVPYNTHAHRLLVHTVLYCGRPGRAQSRRTALYTTV